MHQAEVVVAVRSPRLLCAQRFIEIIGLFQLVLHHPQPPQVLESDVANWSVLLFWRRTTPAQAEGADEEAGELFEQRRRPQGSRWAW